jgi:hypothetical protein
MSPFVEGEFSSFLIYIGEPTDKPTNRRKECMYVNAATTQGKYRTKADSNDKNRNVRITFGFIECVSLTGECKPKELAEAFSNSEMP